MAITGTNAAHACREALAPEAAPRGPVVLLDKDGTLLEDVPYNTDPARMRFAPGAKRGLAMLAAAGFRFAVVSNQSGIARGLCTEADVQRAAAHLDGMLREAGASLAGFYYCPHHPHGSVARYRRECGCRKPQPGLLRQAAVDLGIDLERTWLVGDILDDVEAGRRARCRTILLDNGNETEWRSGRLRVPDLVATDLAEAAQLILTVARAESRAASQEEVA